MEFIPTRILRMSSYLLVQKLNIKTNEPMWQDFFTVRHFVVLVFINFQSIF